MHNFYQTKFASNATDTTAAGYECHRPQTAHNCC